MIKSGRIATTSMIWRRSANWWRQGWLLQRYWAWLPFPKARKKIPWAQQHTSVNWSAPASPKSSFSFSLSSLKTLIPYKQRINQSQRNTPQWRLSLKQTEMLDLSSKPTPQYHFIYVSLPFHILTPLLIQMMKSWWGNNNITLWYVLIIFMHAR